MFVLEQDQWRGLRKSEVHAKMCLSYFAVDPKNVMFVFRTMTSPF